MTTTELRTTIEIANNRLLELDEVRSSLRSSQRLPIEDNIQEAFENASFLEAKEIAELAESVMWIAKDLYIYIIREFNDNAGVKLYR